MAWCKLEDTFRNSPKIKRLARDLGVRPAEARGLMTALWSWATVNAVDGDLRDFDIGEVEEAADWYGEPGLFVNSAIKRNLVDKKRSGLAIHNFLRRAGSYKKAQQKQKERGKRKKATVAKVSRDCRATVALRGEERRGEEKERTGDVAASFLISSDGKEPDWNPGDPIKTAAEFDLAVGSLPGTVGPRDYAKLRVVLSAGPIEHHEFSAALTVAERKRKGIGYLLGTIIGTRNDAEETRCAPPREMTLEERIEKRERARYGEDE